MEDITAARIQSLVERVEGPDDGLAGRAVTELASLGVGAAPAVPALVLALGRDAVAGRASHALTMIGEPAVPELIQALENLHREVRVGAALALRGMGCFAAEAVPALIAALRDGADDEEMAGVAGLAAQALGTIGASALPALVAGLDSKDRRIRRGAAGAFLYMAPENASKAILPLAAALQDEDQTVRRRTAIALSHIGPAASPAVPALLGVLDHPDGHLRSNAVHALEKVRDDRPAVISRLASALSDPDERVRESAISALGNLGSGQAVPALLKVLRDQSDFLGSSAAYALGRLAAWPQLCVPALVTAARTAGDRTRGSAIHALRKMGADGAAPLVAMLRDRDPTIRIAAAYALGDHGQQPPEVIDPLIDALGDTEREVRSAAARALRSIGPAASRSIPALIDALAEQTDFAQWALLAMGELAIPRLVSALANPYAAIRVGAADTLNFMLRLGGEPDWSEAVSTLVEALDDLDPEISFRAAVALRKVRAESKKAIPPRWQAFVERAFIETGGC